MKKRIVAALLCAGLVAFAPAGTMVQTPLGGVFSQTVSAAEGFYLGEHGEKVSLPADAVYINQDNISGNTALSNNLYVFEGNITFSTRLEITGNVTLILADGASINLRYGIHVPEGASLTITAQSEGEDMGSLRVESYYSYAAAIGGGAGTSSDDTTSGNITINGGKITASGELGAAIGGGKGGNGGVIRINGGVIYAEGGYSGGAAIGGGKDGDSGKIYITGGRVTAIVPEVFSSPGAAIGGGYNGDAEYVEISGGIVTATGCYFSNIYGTGASSAIGGGMGYPDVHGIFTTGTSGNAVIFATGGGDAPAIGDISGRESWSGMIFEGDTGRIYGDTFTLTADVTIPEGKTLIIDPNQTLILNGYTLTVEGTVTNNGIVDARTGTIIGEIGGTVLLLEEPDTPSASSESEDEIYLPSTPISDGLHEYSLGKMLYVDGKRVKGLYEYEGALYFFSDQGFMQTGWVELEDGWRYFAEDGKMLTGWLQIGNVWYYLDPETGLMYNDGLATIGKSAYYFYDWGGMASDWWYEAEDGWYFFGGSGAMKTAQWTQWEGDWYYLTETGRMAVDTEVGGFYVNAEGVWIE